ncbi:hypothetical protein UFOVP225_82 [uncultured Caudovirales phage]|uniref:Uncharacterized protein n=1 Tax=uncultured Caudovirales phage TaxID=2100421 RepID=A0A6J5L1X2_9CAUD|nr:hypothetical protein UFOVP113_95 [uncultured Caudovirales phage]CAB5219526.1 hypothetical protein UFOVP225_82 [uncultured Caudovirales phage]
MTDKAILSQIQMAEQLASLITDRLEELEGTISTPDMLDMLAVVGLSLTPTPVSPVTPTITLASEAYFASIGLI